MSGEVGWSDNQTISILKDQKNKTILDFEYLCVQTRRTCPDPFHGEYKIAEKSLVGSVQLQPCASGFNRNNGERETRVS